MYGNFPQSAQTRAAKKAKMPQWPQIGPLSVDGPLKPMLFLRREAAGRRPASRRPGNELMEIRNDREARDD
jgi:hypothetical protein